MKSCILLPPLTEDCVMSEWGQQPSKERWDASQISVLFSLTSSRIWGMRRESARSPQTAIVLAFLSFSALFSASQTGKRLRYNSCPTPSQLSCHWLHMRNNETSSETRLQKRRGGGGCFNIKIVLKEEEEGGCNKKAEALSLPLCGHYLWGGLGICFLSLCQRCRGRPGVVRLGFWLPNRPNPLYRSFFPRLVPFTVFKKSLGHSISGSSPLSLSLSLDPACLNWPIGKDLGWMEGA